LIQYKTLSYENSQLFHGKFTKIRYSKEISILKEEGEAQRKFQPLASRLDKIAGYLYIAQNNVVFRGIKIQGVNHV